MTKEQEKIKEAAEDFLYLWQKSLEDFFLDPQIIEANLEIMLIMSKKYNAIFKKQDNETPASSDISPDLTAEFDKLKSRLAEIEAKSAKSKPIRKDNKSKR